MSTRQPANVRTPLSIARRQLEQWRRRQQGRKRLPQELWAKAVALAQTYGLNKTARTLGLKYDSLKKHLEAAAPDAWDPGKAKPDFIELLPGGLTPACTECTIEWEDGSGATMRMHVKGIGVADLVFLARGFRGGQA
jgi:hypothetical protein